MGGDESMEQEKEQEQEQEKQDEKDEDLVWIEQKDEKELVVVEEEEEEEENVNDGGEGVVASPFKKFASPVSFSHLIWFFTTLIVTFFFFFCWQARRFIPTSFATPQQPKRVLKAPRTSLAPRTRKDVVAVKTRVIESKVSVLYH